MKKSTFFLCLSLLWFLGCKNQEPTKNTPTTPVIEAEVPIHRVTYKGKGDLKNKKIVLISGDEEYRSEESLPQLAKILANHHGFDCTVLFAQDPEKIGIINPNYGKNIPGLEALNEADLMILFTRFRELPDIQMQHFQNYLLRGKPLIGIRTSTHAFYIKDSTSTWKHWGNNNKDEKSEWNGGFGRLVLGERWHTHHGHHKHQSTKGLIAKGAENHPITNGIENGDIWGPTDVYGVRLPLSGDAQHLIMGQVINRKGEYNEADPFYGMKPTDSEVAKVNPAEKVAYNPNNPMMPIAWTKSYKIPKGQPGKSFTSTIGSSTDMTNDGVRRLFVNATYHLLGLSVPEKATVDVVGKYEPSAYSFQKDEYWVQKNLKINELVEDK